MKQWRREIYGLALLMILAVALMRLLPHFGLFVPRYTSVMVLYRSGETEIFTDARYWQDLAGRDIVVSSKKELRIEPSAVRRLELIGTQGAAVRIIR